MRGQGRGKKCDKDRNKAHRREAGDRNPAVLHARLSQVCVASGKPSPFGRVTQEPKKQNRPHQRCQNSHTPTGVSQLQPKMPVKHEGSPYDQALLTPYPPGQGVSSPGRLTCLTSVGKLFFTPAWPQDVCLRLLPHRPGEPRGVSVRAALV